MPSKIITTEVVALNKSNQYVIWERMDRRHKCTWDCAEEQEGFYGTLNQLLMYLNRHIGGCSRKELRVELAENQIDNEGKRNDQ